MTFKKQHDDEDKKKLMLDQNFLKNHLYNTFVLPLMIEQNDIIRDIEVEVHHEILITKITIQKTDTVLPLEIVLVMTKALLSHNTLVHGMTIIQEIRDLIALIIDPPTNDPTDVTLVTDIEQAHILNLTILHDTHLPLDHLRCQENLGFLDLAHIQMQDINLVQSNYNSKLIQLPLKYIYITQPKWQHCNTYKLGLVFIQTYSNK